MTSNQVKRIQFFKKQLKIVTKRKEDNLYYDGALRKLSRNEADKDIAKCGEIVSKIQSIKAEAKAA